MRTIQTTDYASFYSYSLQITYNCNSKKKLLELTHTKYGGESLQSADSCRFHNGSGIDPIKICFRVRTRQRTGRVCTESAGIWSSSCSEFPLTISLPPPSVCSLTVQSHWKQSSGNNCNKQKFLFIWREQLSCWIGFSVWELRGEKKEKTEKTTKRFDNIYWEWNQFTEQFYLLIFAVFVCVCACVFIRVCVRVYVCVHTHS